MFHKKLGDVLLRCTLARESARRLPPPAPKVFPSKSPCQERRLADQRCSSRQSWNTEVLHELRHARNPSDWTSTRCRMVIVEVEGPRPLRSERGACEFDSFHQEPMGSVDEPHGSSETIKRRLSCHARRCSYTKVLERKEKAHGVAALHVHLFGL